MKPTRYKTARGETMVLMEAETQIDQVVFSSLVERVIGPYKAGKSMKIFGANRASFGLIFELLVPRYDFATSAYAQSHSSDPTKLYGPPLLGDATVGVAFRIRGAGYPSDPELIVIDTAAGLWKQATPESAHELISTCLAKRLEDERNRSKRGRLSKEEDLPERQEPKCHPVDQSLPDDPKPTSGSAAEGVPSTWWEELDRYQHVVADAIRFWDHSNECVMELDPFVKGVESIGGTAEDARRVFELRRNLWGVHRALDELKASAFGPLRPCKQCRLQIPDPNGPLIGVWADWEERVENLSAKEVERLLEEGAERYREEPTAFCLKPEYHLRPTQFGSAEKGQVDVDLGNGE